MESLIGDYCPFGGTLLCCVYGMGSRYAMIVEQKSPAGSPGMESDWTNIRHKAALFSAVCVLRR